MRNNTKMFLLVLLTGTVLSFSACMNNENEIPQNNEQRAN